MHLGLLRLKYECNMDQRHLNEPKTWRDVIRCNPKCSRIPAVFWLSSWCFPLRFDAGLFAAELSLFVWWRDSCCFDTFHQLFTSSQLVKAPLYCTRMHIQCSVAKPCHKSTLFCLGPNLKKLWTSRTECIIFFSKEWREPNYNPWAVPVFIVLVLRTFKQSKEPFMEWKGSMDVLHETTHANKESWFLRVYEINWRFGAFILFQLY